MTPEQKEVLKFFPDARCKQHRLVYQGKITIWHIVSVRSDYKYRELSASSENEMLAWKIAKNAAKKLIYDEVLEKLES